MSNGYGRYIAAFIGIVLFVFLGVAVFRMVTRPSKPADSVASSASNSTKPLPEYAGTDAAVRQTTSGPIKADEQHFEVHMTISRDTRTIDIIQGYQNLVVKTEILDNNQEAYSAFLWAISGAGFANSKKAKVGDERAACSSGYRYTYELIDAPNKDENFRHWSASCSLELGTAAGAGPALRALFQGQFPDYATFVTGYVI